MTDETSPPPGAGRTAWRLMLLAFVVYNVNLRSITSADTFPTRYLPISILKERDFDLDEFEFLRRGYPAPAGEEPGGGDNRAGALPYYLQYVRSHYISSYPVMTAVLATPVYAIPVALGLTKDAPAGGGLTWTEVVGTLLAKLSASLAVAVSVGVIYLALLRRTSPRGARAIALVYAFATSSWSVSSQGLWQSSMSQPLLACALWAFVRGRDEPRYVVLAGLPLALSVACRPTALVFALALTLHVLKEHRGLLLRFLVAPGLVAALLALYNLWYFGSLGGGYSSLLASGQGDFGGSFVEGFLGLLVSPGRGLLVYSPVLLFALVGMGQVLAARRDSLLVHTALASALTVIPLSFYTVWHGAFSFSYRLLVDLLPGFSLFLATAWPWIHARRWRAASFAATVVVSVLIQVIGCFFYPCVGRGTPAAAGFHPWDWRQSEIVLCLKAGPVMPDGLRLLRGLTAGDRRAVR